MHPGVFIPLLGVGRAGPGNLAGSHNYGTAMAVCRRSASPPLSLGLGGAKMRELRKSCCHDPLSSVLQQDRPTSARCRAPVQSPRTLSKGSADSLSRRRQKIEPAASGDMFPKAEQTSSSSTSCMPWKTWREVRVAPPSWGLERCWFL